MALQAFSPTCPWYGLPSGQSCLLLLPLPSCLPTLHQHSRSDISVAATAATAAAAATATTAAAAATAAAANRHIVAAAAFANCDAATVAVDAWPERLYTNTSTQTLLASFLH